MAGWGGRVWPLLQSLPSGPPLSAGFFAAGNLHRRRRPLPLLTQLSQPQDPRSWSPLASRFGADSPIPAEPRRRLPASHSHHPGTKSPGNRGRDPYTQPGRGPGVGGEGERRKTERPRPTSDSRTTGLGTSGVGSPCPAPHHLSGSFVSKTVYTPVQRWGLGPPSSQRF